MMECWSCRLKDAICAGTGKQSRHRDCAIQHSDCGGGCTAYQGRRVFRGVNTGVVQNTPGGGMGGFGSGERARARVALGRRGRRRCGRRGWCSRRWEPEPTYHRMIRRSTATFGIEHNTRAVLEPGIPTVFRPCKQNTNDRRLQLLPGISDRHQRSCRASTTTGRRRTVPSSS